ncbi:6-bladed beta-propeller [uncultured Algoriphagus sp.]|uniref:6-bladed beta-propeller n=1 Tax=uncultured Algoriphagus sp. TaxID=417365 RepID=UPI0030EB7B10|tara:strand:+ start:1208 stop:2389 length:1182 start_codon:yes stop_codon:yes gene_type:complete
MKSIKTLLFNFAVLMLFTCVSCSKEKTMTKGNILTIETNESIDLKLSELFDTLLIVPLEATEKSFIGRISKVITTKQYIFVLDNSIAESLFIFDYDGRIINSFQGTGSGPGEYIRVSNFILSHDEKSVFIKDHSLGKILELDLNGEVIRDLSFSEGIGYHDLYPFEDGFYAVLPADNNIGVKIDILDADLKSTGVTIPIKESDIKIEDEFKNQYFYRGSNGEILFKRKVDNTLSYINENDSSTFVEFSFDKNEFNTLDIPWNKGAEAIHQDNVINEIWLNNFYAFSDQIIDLKDYTLFNVWHGKSWKILAMNKLTLEARFIDKMENDMDGLIANIPGIFPANANANQMVLDIAPDDLFSLNAVLENPTKYSDRIREVEKQIVENPVLFIYRNN